MFKFQFNNRFKIKTYNYKKPFIIPTRLGVYFGLGILVLIILAYTYASQLLYLISFFFSCVYFLTMHLTNNNMKGLQINSAVIEPFFQDEIGFLEIIFENKNKKYNNYFFKSALDLNNVKADLVFFNQDTNSTSIQELDFENIPPNTTLKVKIAVKAFQHGYFEIPAIKVFSQFPFSFFYCWKNIKIYNHFWVYPKRSGNLSLPIHTNESFLKKYSELLMANNITQSMDSTEFIGHKKYSELDLVQRIDWKVFAKKRLLLTKMYFEDLPGIIFIDFFDSRLPAESNEKIQQISQWFFLSANENAYFLNEDLPINHPHVTSKKHQVYFRLKELSIHKISTITEWHQSLQELTNYEKSIQ